MKIKGSDLEYIRNRANKVIEGLDIEVIEETYKDLSKTRFHMDLFYACKIKIGDGVGMSGDIDIYDCNDSHIETAMKTIVKENNLSYIGK